MSEIKETSNHTTNTTATSSSVSTGSKDNNLSDVTKMFNDTKIDVNGDGEKKSIMATYKDIFGMADGDEKTKATDLIIDSDKEVDALTALKAKINVEKIKDDDTNSSSKKWNLEATMPFVNALDTTVDEILLAFLRWTRKDFEEGKKINVNKAYNRLEQYVKWMYDMKDELITTSHDKIKKSRVVQAMGMKMTHGKSGHLLWWFDMASMDTKSIKDGTISLNDSLQYFVWAAHVCMLDKYAQDNGILFIEEFGNMGFWETMTLFPLDLSAKLDKLTIGVLPVQMKGMHIIHAAGWLKLLMTLMKPFMSKKMRSRIVTYSGSSNKNGETISKITNDVVGGKEYVPKNFMVGFDGTLETDIIYSKLGISDDNADGTYSDDDNDDNNKDGKRNEEEDEDDEVHC